MAIGVEVAAIGIANTGVAVGAVGATARVALAAALVDDGARVGGPGGSSIVSLPDVHLRAASAVAAGTGVLVVAGRIPALDVGLAVDELDVTRALSVAVTSTVFGTSLVARELGKTAIQVHGDEVQGTVEATANVGDIDIEGELVAKELEACQVFLLVARCIFSGL